MANPSDTPLQAQTRAVIGLPDNIPWSDANVRAYLSQRGFQGDLADKVIATASGTATPATTVANMTPIAPAGPAAKPGQRLQPVNPNQPANQWGEWVDTQTGAHYQGQIASNNPNLLVTGYSRGNVSNTTSYDINTGQKHEAMPHPWVDALKNTALIWGGPETAGVLSGAFGGAGAAEAASGGAASSAAGATPTLAGAGIPSLASGGAGSFGGAASAGAGAAATTAGAATATAIPPIINDAANAGGWASMLKKVLPAAALTATAIGSRPSLAPGAQEMNQSIAALVPILESLLKSQVARQTQNQPLYDQVLRMATGQLPNWTKGGG